MRPTSITFSPTVATVGGVAASQTPSGAGAVTLNGTLVSGGIATFGSPQIVTIASGSDISNRTFTVTGKDRDGNTLTEVITGPNNETVSSTEYFYSVTGVTISGAAAGAITMGVSGLGVTSPIPLDTYINPPNTVVAVTAVTGATYKMQYTYDNVQATTWPNGTQNWTDDGDMTGKTAAFVKVLTTPVTAVRLVITTAASPQSITATVTQAGAPS